MQEQYQEQIREEIQLLENERVVEGLQSGQEK